MLKSTIRADEKTNVESAISELRSKCVGSSLEPSVIDLLLSQSREILGPLVERGTQLAAMGSQMHVTREIVGSGYAITLIFRIGDNRSFFGKLFDSLRGK